MTNIPPSERKIELTFSRGFGYEPAKLWVCEWEPGLFVINTTDPAFTRKLEARKDISWDGSVPWSDMLITYGKWRKIRRLVDQFLASSGRQVVADLRAQNASIRGTTNGGL